jgi:hypothetical protein
MGSYVDYNVIGVVKANGEYSFHIKPDSTCSFDHLSRESAQPPVLMITTGGVVSPTPGPFYKYCRSGYNIFQHGDAISSYETANYAFGSAPKSELRTCNDGVLTGTYLWKSSLEYYSTATLPNVENGPRDGMVLTTWYTKSNSVPSTPSGKRIVKGAGIALFKDGYTSWNEGGISTALKNLSAATPTAISYCRSQGKEAVFDKPNVARVSGTGYSMIGSMTYACMTGKKYFLESNNLVQTDTLRTTQLGTKLPARVCLTEVPDAAQTVLLAPYKEDFLGMPLSVTIPAGSKCADYVIHLKDVSSGSYAHAKLNGHLAVIALAPR